MNDSVETDSSIVPLADSADGRRNSFTLACTPTGQSMNYAACLWRQGVLANPKTITPPDWDACKQARKEGRCTALAMRQEEELTGKSIYFRCRGALNAAAQAARDWIMPPKTSRTAAAPPPAPIRPKTMLDAMAGAGDFTDAIAAAAKEPAVTAPKLPRAPAPVSIAGETPLQMARRLHAERQSQL